MKKKLIFVAAVSLLLAGCGKAASSVSTAGTSNNVSTSTDASASVSSDATDTHVAIPMELSEIFKTLYYSDITVEASGYLVDKKVFETKTELAGQTFKATFGLSTDSNHVNATVVGQLQETNLNLINDPTKTQNLYAVYAHLSSGAVTEHIDPENCDLYDEVNSSDSIVDEVGDMGFEPIVNPLMIDVLSYTNPATSPNASKLTYDATKGVYSETVPSVFDSDGFTISFSFTNHVLVSASIVDLHHDHTSLPYDKVNYVYSKLGTTADSVSEEEKSQLNRVILNHVYSCISDEDLANYSLQSAYDNVFIDVRSYKNATGTLVDMNEGIVALYATDSARIQNTKNGRFYTMKVDEDKLHYRYNIYDTIDSGTPSTASLAKGKLAYPTEEENQTVYYMTSSGYQGTFVPYVHYRTFPMLGTSIVSATYDASKRAYCTSLTSGSVIITIEYRFFMGTLVEAIYRTNEPLSISLDHQMEVYNYESFRVVENPLRDTEIAALDAIA